MHDGVDHAVSLRSRRGPLPATTSDGTAPRLQSAEQTGQVALLESSRTLGVLRERPDPDHPLPDLAAMAGLAEHFRAAGLDVALQVDDQTPLRPQRGAGCSAVSRRG